MKGVQCYELFGGIALKITHFIVFTLRDVNGRRVEKLMVDVCCFTW